MKTKKCNRCKKKKNLNQFNKNKSCQDKLDTYCRNCRRIVYQENKKQIKEYYQINKIKILKRIKKYYRLNEEKIKEWNRNFYAINKNKYKKLMVKRDKARLKTDINYKIRSLLKTRLYLALKGNPKLSTTMNLIGCSIEKLKKHLESKFTKGMTWDNYGRWHIDHIRPCTNFDLSKPSEQHKCFNYKNLQPLWAIDNLKKSNKY